MTRPILLGSVSTALLLFTLLASPYCFAGHGGGFGGGGFHGGGGGGFHGGGGGAYHGGGYGGYHGGYSGGGFHASAYSQTAYYGGYHGAGYYRGGYRGGGSYYAGYRGGYYGWHGGYAWRSGYWGYPGWGFGVSFNFGWGGYWPSYPYYVYTPAPVWAPYCSPYYPCSGYPYYAPVSTAPDTTVYDQTSSTEQDAPDTVAQPHAKPYVPPAQPQAERFSTPPSGATIVNASYRPAPNQPAATAYSHPTLTRAQLDQLRPEVQNVVQALRNMPPGAAERQIASGRYSNLSTHELQVVRYAVGLAAAP